MTRTRRLVVALAINVALVVAQVVAGALAHSTGLLSDAGHNLSDAAGVVLSLLAVRFALRPRTPARSFGNARATILAALMNAALLAVVTVLIMVEAVRRLVHPVGVEGSIVVPVAAAAIVANLAAALVLRDRGHDLNMRAAMAHMAADALSSAVVLVAGAIILVTGGGAWNRLDPAASLVVAVLIVIEALRLIKESTDVLLESTPSDVDLGHLERVITELPGVDEVHDLHVWSLSSEYRALSAHVVMTGHPSLEEAQEVGGRVRAAIQVPFDIAHTTFELECERCVDEHDPEALERAHGGVPMVFPTVTEEPGGVGTRARRSPE